MELLYRLHWRRRYERATELVYGSGCPSSS